VPARADNTRTGRGKSTIRENIARGPTGRYAIDNASIASDGNRNPHATEKFFRKNIREIRKPLCRNDLQESLFFLVWISTSGILLHLRHPVFNYARRPVEGGGNP
jgi:hypothetical protein